MSNEKYDRAYHGNRYAELTQKLKICLNCMEIELQPNPKNPEKPYGIVMAPICDILKVIDYIDNTKTSYIEIHWACPICHKVKTIDKFNSFDDLLIYLKELKKHVNKISSTVDRIIQLLEEKKYENLPGYTATSVVRSINYGKPEI